MNRSILTARGGAENKRGGFIALIYVFGAVVLFLIQAFALFCLTVWLFIKRHTPINKTNLLYSIFCIFLEITISGKGNQEKSVYQDFQ